MHSTRHDSPLPSSSAGSAPGQVLDVVVLTSDAGLLATLREAASAEHALWHAPSAEAAVDYLVGGRCGILVADLGTLRGDVASLLERLQTQFPELVLIATGRREEEAKVAALVGDGRIYRFLHKPVSPARASLFLSAATRRYFEIRNVEPFVLTTVKTIARRSKAAAPLLPIVLAVLVIVLGLVWFFAGPHRFRLDDGAGARATDVAHQVEELLGRAKIALATGRLAEPRGDNALELYREVLALVPNHPEAKAGEERVLTALEAKVIAALSARDPQAGAAALSLLQRAQPDHPRYGALYEQLIALSRSQTPRSDAPRVAAPSPQQTPSAAQAASDAQVAAPNAAVDTDAPESIARETENRDAEEEILASETDSLDAEALDDESTAASGLEEAAVDEDWREELALATRLRERGALIEPAEHNAFDRLAAVREQYADRAEVIEEQRRLATTLLDHARTHLAAGNLDQAKVYLDKATELQPNLPALGAVRTRLQASLAEAERNRVVPAASLRRLREVPPEYPLEARSRGIEGWVDIEFTIAADGAPHDLAVRAAEPRGVFERSALDALRRWRFEPIVRDGQAVEQRAFIRLQYRLGN